MKLKLFLSHLEITKKKRWVYIDVGRYNGLAETEGEAIHYRNKSKSHQKVKKENFILAGPSCDSHDVIYQKKDCILPANLKCGDKLRILSTGAYTMYTVLILMELKVSLNTLLNRI